MWRDVTKEVLDEVKEGLLWNNVGLITSCKRSEIESGKVRIVRAGDNTLHPMKLKSPYQNEEWSERWQMMAQPSVRKA